MLHAATHVATIEAMGTVASVHLYDDLHVVGASRIESGLRAFGASLRADEAMFSTFRDNSVLSRINRAELDIADAPKEVAEVLDACTWLEHKSHGAFNTRRPDSPSIIDPAGFVKGWAAQRAAQRLSDAGLVNWSVNVGGDLIVHGAPDRDRAPWSIAIVDPRDERVVFATIPLEKGAVATSGTAQRGNHIWNAVDTNASSLLSFTVIGPELTWADAFATTGFAMGHSGIEWVSQFDGYDSVAIDHDANVRLSQNFG